MKAFVVTHYGPDGLNEAQVPTPTGGRHDVFVDVRATSINHSGPSPSPTHSRQRSPTMAEAHYVLSTLSWIGTGDGYSATKAALWSATNTQRIALAPSGTVVTALHLDYTDTPMTAGLDVTENDPTEVVEQAYDGIEAGANEILADEISTQAKAGLAGPITALYPQPEQATH